MNKNVIFLDVQGIDCNYVKMEEKMELAELAVEFVKKKFREYFIDGQKNTFKDVYIKGAEYIGIHSSGKAFKDSDVDNLLVLKRVGALDICAERYDTTIIDEKTCLVHGVLDVSEQTKLTRNIRFSMLCIQEKQRFKVAHAHFSAATDSQCEKLYEQLVLKTAQVALNEKKFEVIKNNAELILFDYYPDKDKVVFYKNIARKNGFPKTINRFLNRILAYGLLYKSSVADFLAAFDKIRGSEEQVETEIVVWRNSEYRMYNVRLQNIQVDDVLPICVMGIAKDITAEKLLVQEKQYKEILASKASSAYVVNINKDEFIEPIKTLPKEYAANVGDSFSKFINVFANEFVHPQDREQYLQNFSAENIKKRFAAGRFQYSFGYRKMIDSKKYKWLESNACLLEHSMTKEIIAYFQVADITEVKTNEKRMAENERYNKFLIESNTFVLEMNITKNIITRGKELLIKDCDASCSSDYTQQILLSAKKFVHEEDVSEYLATFSRENILQQFYSGNKNIYLEFRRRQADGTIRWMVCKLYLLEDNFSKEVKGLMHIEDIDERKKHELELIYRSERDALTGFYNKQATQKYVEKFLNSEEALSGVQALLLYDLDYFKNINDKFGHLFGDKVLVEIADIVRNIMDARSIIGRVGGDEFLVFLPAASSQQKVLEIAELIVKAINRQYSKAGKFQEISASVGVAFYPEHGKNYKQLYVNADKALYLAKDRGKSQVVICEKKQRK